MMMKVGGCVGWRVLVVGMKNRLRCVRESSVVVDASLDDRRVREREERNGRDLGIVALVVRLMYLNWRGMVDVLVC